MNELTQSEEGNGSKKDGIRENFLDSAIDQASDNQNLAEINDHFDQPLLAENALETRDRVELLELDADDFRGRLEAGLQPAGEGAGHDICPDDREEKAEKHEKTEADPVRHRIADDDIFFQVAEQTNGELGDIVGLIAKREENHEVARDEAEDDLNFRGLSELPLLVCVRDFFLCRFLCGCIVVLGHCGVSANELEHGFGNLHHVTEDVLNDQAQGHR